MHRLLAICFLLATATDEAHGHFFRRWVTRSQQPAPWLPWPAAANQDEKLPASVVDTAWSKLADHTDNSVMYLVETKQVLFVFAEIPAPVTTPENTTNTDAPSRSTSAPAMSTSAPATSTSAPATSTSAPATSSSAPATSTSVPATSTSVPATSSSAPATSTSAPATNTSALTTSTSAPATSTNAPLPSSTIPPEYKYYSATGSYYKLHHEMERSWSDANATCVSEGAHLAVINDAAEADIYRRIVRETVGDNYGTWLGLRDDRPGGVSDWRTVHGEPLSEVFHEWYAGRPYDDGGLKCGVFSATSNRLFDRPCNDYLKWHFICEISQ